MAMILTFTPAQPNAARPKAVAGATTAELIFFPGIRYERHEEIPPTAKRRKRSRQHEVLELPD